MDRVSLWELWVLNQGTWVASHLPVYRVIDTLTLVLAVDPSVGHEPTLDPLGCHPGTPGEHCPRQSPVD